MKKREAEPYRELLLTAKATVTSEIHQIAKEASKSQREAAGDISAYTYHMADVAGDHYDRELSLNIASTEQRTLYEIDEALKRIDDGSYGACLECGKPIPQKRLKAVPYASLCIACQRSKESRRRS